MKSSSDGCERSVTLTRRTATVIISAPLRSKAAAISSLSRYFPVPMIRRELNSRPAMMSLSFILRHRSYGATEIRREGETRRKGDKETRCFSAFLLVPLSPCLLVFLSLCLCVSVAISSVLALPDLDRGELDCALVRAGKTDDQNIAFAQMRGGFLKIFETTNRPAIGFEDDVAGREARIGGGA